MAAYFEFEVTTMASSQKVQRRDLASFLNFMLAEVGNDKLPNWTPRLSQAFKTWLQNETLGENTRQPRSGARRPGEHMRANSMPLLGCAVVV